MKRRNDWREKLYECREAGLQSEWMCWSDTRCVAILGRSQRAIKATPFLGVQQRMLSIRGLVLSLRIFQADLTRYYSVGKQVKITGNGQVTWKCNCITWARYSTRSQRHFWHFAPLFYQGRIVNFSGSANVSCEEPAPLLSLYCPIFPVQSSSYDLSWAHFYPGCEKDRKGKGFASLPFEISCNWADGFSKV